MTTPHITRAVDLQSLRVRPVESFERPLKGDQEASTSFSPRGYLALGIIVVLCVMLYTAVFLWWILSSNPGGAQ